jgi:hypothetical protein
MPSYLSPSTPTEKQENSCFFDQRGKLIKALVFVMHKNNKIIDRKICAHQHFDIQGLLNSLIVVCGEINSLEYEVYQSAHFLDIVSHIACLHEFPIER